RDRLQHLAQHPLDEAEPSDHRPIREGGHEGDSAKVVDAKFGGRRSRTSPILPREAPAMEGSERTTPPPPLLQQESPCGQAAGGGASTAVPGPAQASGPGGDEMGLLDEFVLGRGTCPRCFAPLRPLPLLGQALCGRCGTRYTADGEADPNPAAAPPDGTH